MKIIFKQNKTEVILTIERTDGTTTWSKLRRGIEDHDLAHFAVEQHLEFDQAFYGLVDSGIDIADFASTDLEKKNNIIKNLPIESIQTEFIVNLLQTEYWNSKLDTSFLITLENILKEKNLPFPESLTEKKLSDIRKDYQSLVLKLKSLKEGESLELIF